MAKIWITREGVYIPYKKLEDDHLLNILRIIEKWARSGITIQHGGGVDVDDIWFDEEYLKGREVFIRYDYKGLIAEAHKRKDKRLKKYEPQHRAIIEEQIYAI